MEVENLETLAAIFQRVEKKALADWD